MSVLTLFLVAAMMMLPNVSSISPICTNNVTLEHMSTIGDSLVLCDHGRIISVEKLPERAFLIKVHNCSGNFDEFALKALRTIHCADGLVYMLQRSSRRTNIQSFYAYAEISNWY